MFLPLVVAPRAKIRHPRLGHFHLLTQITTSHLRLQLSLLRLPARDSPLRPLPSKINDATSIATTATIDYIINIRNNSIYKVRIYYHPYACACFLLVSYRASIHSHDELCFSLDFKRCSKPLVSHRSIVGRQEDSLIVQGAFLDQTVQQQLVHQSCVFENDCMTEPSIDRRAPMRFNDANLKSATYNPVSWSH